MNDIAIPRSAVEITPERLNGGLDASAVRGRSPAATLSVELLD